MSDDEKALHPLLSRATIRQFISYFGVGGVSALVEWVVFYLLGRLFGMTYMPATVLAFLFSTTTNWLLGRRFTFRNSKLGKSKGKEALQVFFCQRDRASGQYGSDVSVCHSCRNAVFFFENDRKDPGDRDRFHMELSFQKTVDLQRYVKAYPVLPSGSSPFLIFYPLPHFLISYPLPQRPARYVRFHGPR